MRYSWLRWSLGWVLTAAMVFPAVSRASDESLIDSAGHPDATAPSHPFSPLTDKPKPASSAHSPKGKKAAHGSAAKGKRTAAKKQLSKKPLKKKK